jgi:hypothetical protein
MTGNDSMPAIVSSGCQRQQWPSKRLSANSLTVLQRCNNELNHSQNAVVTEFKLDEEGDLSIQMMILHSDK